MGRMISQTKPLKIKSFLPYNFAFIKICVAIRLAENGTRSILVSFSAKRIATRTYVASTVP